jgi:hypothetical protein
MATGFIFNGRKETLAGVYGTIKSGIQNPPITADYGTVLIIDNGLGASWGGGAGIDGTLANKADAIYVFYDLLTYRSFLKGGKFWKLAEPLFKPRKTEPGVSKIYHVKAATTAPATLIFIATGGGAKGGTFKIKVRDEGVIGNGSQASGHLDKGYAFTLETGVLNITKWIMKLWVGTYKGAYPTDGTYYGEAIGAELIYDEVLPEDAPPILLAKSPEFNNIADLIAWAKSDGLFNQYFALDTTTSAVVGNGSVNSADIANYSGNTLATGGTETYSSANLDLVLEQVKDLDYVFILSDKYGITDYDSIEVGKMLAHIQTEAKYRPNKYLFYGAGLDDSEFAQASASSLAVAEYFNAASGIVIHSGVKKVSQADPTGFRIWDAQFHAAALLGRLCGLPPQVPLTFKSVGIEGLVHNLNQREREQALAAGILTSYFDTDFNDFICLMDINSLQNNANLINPDGTSYSIQVMRIAGQINHDLIVNAKIQLMGQPNGVNRNTLSANYVKNWTMGFLQTKVATASQDNLILSFPGDQITVTPIEDSYWVSYAIVINNEIDKIFFTGFMIE